tara:strand:+ start:8274 stop:10397 length:2124 start_codon:yes stop_codon:yes gene_type:complete
MATHDYVIDNSTGANVRADINSVLQAILTNNSSSSAPSTTAAYMWWADTTNGVLKIRNSSDNAWVELLQLDGTLTLEDGSASTPGLAFRDDLNTGIFSSAADTFDIATGGVGRFQIDSSEITFNDSGNDTDFRIEGSSITNLFFLNAGLNRLGIGVTSPDCKLHIHEGTAGSIDSVSNSVLTLENNNSVILQMLCPSGSSAQLRFGDESNNGAGFIQYSHSANAMLFATTDGSERMRLDSSGRLLIGHSTVTPVDNDANNPHFQVEGTGANDSRISIRHNSTTSSSAGTIYLSRSKGTSTGAKTSVAEDDALGTLIFMGADGTHDTRAAQIRAECDGTPGDNDMPGRLIFETTPDGGLNTSERMRIDSSGHVGIGLAPANSFSFGKALDIGSSTGAFVYVRDTDVTDAVGGIGYSNDGLFIGNEKSDGYIRFSTNTSATERMRIDSSGNVLIGTTGVNNSSVSGQALQVSGTTRPTLILRGNASGSNICEIHFADNSGSDSDPGTRVGMIQYSHVDNNFRFRVNETDRVRIPSKGGIIAEFNDNDSLGYRFKRVQGSNNHNLLATTYSSTNVEGGGTESFVVQTDGDVQNLNNSYGQISDIKYKENIVDASSQWEDIKAIRVRKFNFKAETDFGTHTQIGVVAQELETVSPKLINTKTDFDEDGTDLGTTTKVVKYSVLYMKAIKALQEAITKIELLETKVAALEAA